MVWSYISQELLINVGFLTERKYADICLSLYCFQSITYLDKFIQYDDHWGAIKSSWKHFRFYLVQLPSFRVIAYFPYLQGKRQEQQVSPMAGGRNRMLPVLLVIFLVFIMSTDYVEGEFQRISTIEHVYIT